jgi:hypothetical protein
MDFLKFYFFLKREQRLKKRFSRKITTIKSFYLILQAIYIVNSYESFAGRYAVV